MSAYKKILIAARRSLIVLAVTLTATVGLFVGARYLAEQAKIQQQTVQQLEAQSVASLGEKQADAVSLVDEIHQFKALQEQGLVGLADREGWVEQLIVSRDLLALPNTLTYTLQPPKLLTQQGEETAVVTGEPDAMADGPSFHDLDFQINDIHEGELLALLRVYQSRVKGRFRVNACSLAEPSETGLTIRCTLRFLTLPVDRAKVESLS
jgi:hypothetical protein